MLVGALTGYAGRAYGACSYQGNAGGRNLWRCENASPSMFINSNFADVYTVSGFSVTTTVGSSSALQISGDGALTYRDAYESDLTSTNGAALVVVSSNASASPSGITVTTNGDLTGGSAGVSVENNGAGGIDLTFGGTLTSTGGFGLAAINQASSTGDMTVNVASVRGASTGINLLNFGLGAVDLTATGDVQGGSDDGMSVLDLASAGTTIRTTSVQGDEGIDAYSRGALSITSTGTVTGTGRSGISAQSSGSSLTIVAASVQGRTNAIDATNYGTGALSITASGDVRSTNAIGIYAKNYSTATDLIIDAGPVAGVGYAISAQNEGGGRTTITTRGIVTASATAIRVETYASTTDLTVNTGPGAVRANRYGIEALQRGTGDVEITVGGDISASSVGQAIRAYVSNSSSSADLIVTSAANTTISGGNGIVALNYGSGATRVTVNGDVSGTSGTAVIAYNAPGSSSPIEIVVGRTGSVAASTYGIRTNNRPTDIIVAGSVSGTQGAIRFNSSGPAQDDRLELRPGYEISGNVLARGGTDALEFGGSGSDGFDLTEIGPKYQDFEEFAVIGGRWAFSGATIQSFDVSGGSLGGTGSFGDVNILSGGSIAPGNSIGTLTVGNITFDVGSTYEVEVDADGNSDLIDASGTATINGGRVSVLAQSGDYDPRTTYTILTAAGGRTGTFTDVTSNLAFLDPSLSYDANNVYLSLERVVVIDTDTGEETFLSFCAVATSSNQCNVARALDVFPTDNALFLDVLNQTAEGARQAFDALSGEIHASVGGALLDEGRHVRDAVMGRLVQASYNGTGLGSGGPQSTSGMMMLGYGSKDLGSYEPLPAVSEGPVFWTQGFGSWANFDGNGNAASLDRDMGGFISGVDAEVMPGWRAGIAAGYSYTGLDEDARLSSANVDAYHLVLYGSGKVNRFNLRGGGAWTWQDIETSRNVVFPGFSEFEEASYDGDRGQIFGEIAYPVVLHPSIAMEGFSGLAYVHQETDGFTESGALAALTSAGYAEDVTYSTTGFRAATTMAFGNTVITPNLSVAWLHAFDSVDTDLAMAFASAGPDFTIQGTPITRDSALVQAGLDFAVTPDATLSIAYDGQFASDADEHGIKGRASWKF